jgi:hypothetical protein
VLERTRPLSLFACCVPSPLAQSAEISPITVASVEGRGFIAAKTATTYVSVGTVTNTAKVANVLFVQVAGSTGWLFSGGANGDVINGQTLNAAGWITNVVYKEMQVSGYVCTGKMDVIVVNIIGDPARAQDYVASARPSTDCANGYVQVSLAIGPSIDIKNLHSSATARFNIMITQMIS